MEVTVTFNTNSVTHTWLQERMLACFHHYHCQGNATRHFNNVNRTMFTTCTAGVHYRIIIINTCNKCMFKLINFTVLNERKGYYFPLNINANDYWLLSRVLHTLTTVKKKIGKKNSHLQMQLIYTWRSWEVNIYIWPWVWILIRPHTQT